MNRIFVEPQIMDGKDRFLTPQADRQEINIAGDMIYLAGMPPGFQGILQSRAAGITIIIGDPDVAAQAFFDRPEDAFYRQPGLSRFPVKVCYCEHA